MTQQDDRSALEHALIVSSDGHATAKMRGYRPYLDPGVREEFDEFCDRFDVEGMTTADPKSLANRIDPELVKDWVATVLDEGRVDGQWDPVKRLGELDHEGISGEVIFPDFGLPFELHPPLVAAIVGYAETKIVEKSDRDVWELGAEILETLLDKTGFEKGEIDGLILSSSMTGAGNCFWSQTTADQLALDLRRPRPDDDAVG